ncbi:PREDICTED: uncharacterized protein LOC107880381 [Prunus mume]|uniref:Uncharacterized protein LOC107880381 n=1 Tax=Prunus mume TaxID=102107 RepID=A0ABM1LIG1_PRUMU|nr:PREDICTED: uncharacterized protein LOC107880381 [Prunus mume]
MQSIFVANNSVAHGEGKSKSVRVNHLISVPALHMYSHMRVRSKVAKDGQKEQPCTVTDASKSPPILAPLPSKASMQTCSHSVGQRRRESTQACNGGVCFSSGGYPCCGVEVELPVDISHLVKLISPVVAVELSKVRINGRLAMVGFVSALALELYNGQDVFAQISNGGVTLFVATSILLSVASLVPLFKGASVESRSDGIMTSDAELLNRRLAMLGLVAFVFTEYVKGGTLV